MHLNPLACFESVLYTAGAAFFALAVSFACFQNRTRPEPRRYYPDR